MSRPGARHSSCGTSRWAVWKGCGADRCAKFRAWCVAFDIAATRAKSGVSVMVTIASILFQQVVNVNWRSINKSALKQDHHQRSQTRRTAPWTRCLSIAPISHRRSIICSGPKQTNAELVNLSIAPHGFDWSRNLRRERCCTTIGNLRYYSGG